jgi:hypothetical protein
MDHNAPDVSVEHLLYCKTSRGNHQGVANLARKWYISPPSFSLFATVKGEALESAGRSEALPSAMPAVSGGGKARQ